MSGSRAMANTGPFGNLFLLPGAICGGRVDSFAWENVLFPGAKTISGAYFQPVTISHVPFDGLCFTSVIENPQSQM